MANFASIPWEKVEGTWHKTVPYVANPNALQNLEIWIPSSEESPAAEAILAGPGLWVIYIHGGAWRDPLVDSSSLLPALQKIQSTGPLKNVAGYASLNYTLSPHPKHPTHPSDSTDPSRNGKHPDHIVDVLTAIAYLQQNFDFGSNYILSGHSCGATLAFQTVMPAFLEPATVKPKCILGLDGIYDEPNLIKNAGPKHEQWSALYETFTRSAFGDDEKVWQEISPVSVEDWAESWKDGLLAVLVQSKEDTLVPYNQLEGMKIQLFKSKAATLEVFEIDGYDDHNDLWKKGTQLADIITKVVKKLS